MQSYRLCLLMDSFKKTSMHNLKGRYLFSGRKQSKRTETYEIRRFANSDHFHIFCPEIDAMNSNFLGTKRPLHTKIVRRSILMVVCPYACPICVCKLSPNQLMELEGAAHQFVLRKWPEALRKTSAPIEAWKCNFPLF